MQRIQGIPENTKVKLADMEIEQKEWLKKYVDIDAEMELAKQHVKKSEMLCGMIFLVGVGMMLFMLSHVATILLLFGELWSGVVFLSALALSICTGYVVVRETRHAKKVIKSLQTGDISVEYTREGLRCRLKVYMKYCNFFDEEI